MNTMQVDCASVPRTRYIGNYRIVRPLGEGGTALVFLGEHLHKGTRVAIKVPRHQSAASFLSREARLLANLSHPHIIRLHEYGRHRGLPFLVADYAPYGDLRQQYGSQRVLPLVTVRYFARQIAGALQYIHARGLLHCDIKPENLLLLRPDHLMLGDFSIATVEQYASEERRKAGTLRYMAPEQLMGIPCQHSDQYSLAIVIYEWLCGEPPFSGTALEVMRQHLSASPSRLHRAGTMLPVDIEHVLHKALAKDPVKRFSSVEEFYDALEKSSAKQHYIKYNLDCREGRRSNFYATKTPYPGEKNARNGPASTNWQENITLVSQTGCLIAAYFLALFKRIDIVFLSFLAIHLIFLFLQRK